MKKKLKVGTVPWTEKPCDAFQHEYYELVRYEKNEPQRIFCRKCGRVKAV